MPTMRGSGSAPAPASSSSTPRWSMRVRASPGASLAGLAAEAAARRLCQHCRGGGERVAGRRCVNRLLPTLAAVRARRLRDAAATLRRRLRQLPRSARPGNGQRRRSPRGRGGRGDPAARRQRGRRGARHDARADCRRAAKLGHRRRRLPGLCRAAAAAPVTYDGRETAPAAASPALVPQGRPADAVRGRRARRQERRRSGQYADDGAALHRKHGKLPWAALFEPAIRLARDGFAMTERLNFALARGDDEGSSMAALSPAARALYFGADGQPLPVGTIVRNPALAAFLRAARRARPRQLLCRSERPGDRRRGQRRAAQPVADDARRCRDLRRQAARRRFAATYRGHRICGMGPPSSGGDHGLRHPQAARALRSGGARAERPGQPGI